MDRLTSGLAAAVIEAWQELRIHKLRVLLSLLGVCIAVAALSATSAMAQIGKQALVEQYERDGRPALLTSYVYSDDGEGLPVADPAVRTAFETVSDRFDISYRSAVGNTMLEAGPAGGSAPALSLQASLVDADFAPMHRVVVDRGRWLQTSDTANRSPAVVVEPKVLRKLGLREAALPTGIDLVGPQDGRTVRATVVGVTAQDSRNGAPPTAYLLYDAYFSHFPGAGSGLSDVTWQMWVPVPGSEELAVAVGAALRAELPGYQADTSRGDYLSWGGADELEPIAWVVTAISGLILLLGALSLLNVTLITIQQRIREIGIRRSFGATTGRIFFSVVMESIVATTVAGLVGVMIAIAAVNGPWTATYLLDGIDDPPAFPVSAALVGLGASLAVGALAGVLPALVASRVRIINAIRF